MSHINPFNPNSVVVPTLFAGRIDQINSVCLKLQQIENGLASSFFISGERGIGKTALAKLILSIAKANEPNFYNLDLLTSYYSVENGQSINSVLQESVNKLTDNMDKSIIESISSKVGELFSNGKFKIGAYGVEASVEAGDKQNLITIKDQSVSILSNIISSLKDSENSQKGILIIIDEMHNLKNISDSASILRGIITTLDVEQLGNVSFLLIGYPCDTDDFFSNDESARRLFDLIPLHTMPKKEAMAVLEKGFKSIDVTWDKKALEENIDSTGGYPHSIQILGHNLIRLEKNNNIDQQDWEDAMFTTSIELQKKDFSNMYSFNKKLTNKDKILRALAEEDKPLTRKSLNIKLPFEVSQYIKPLIKRGAIRERDEVLQLHSQLFRTAIRIDKILRHRTIKN